MDTINETNFQMDVFKGGNNALFFIVCLDIKRAFAEITKWLDDNEGYLLKSFTMSPLQLDHKLTAKPIPAVGVTAICERGPRDAAELYTGDLHACVDRILRDKGASNRDVTEAINDSVRELSRGYSIIRK